MKKIFAIILVILLISLLGCTTTNTNDVNSDNNQNNNLEPVVQKLNVEKIEVIHFHGTNQCYSCIRLGELTESTINTNFSEELASGKITFEHINAELAENYDIAKKYGVTGSSIWVGTYGEEGFHKENQVKLWYKLENPADFEEYLSEIINKRLDGIIK